MPLKTSIKNLYQSLKDTYLDDHSDSNELREALKMLDRMLADENFYRSKSRSYARQKIKEEKSNFRPDENMLKFYRDVEQAPLIDSDGLFSWHGVHFLFGLTSQDDFLDSGEGRELFSDFLLDLVDGDDDQQEKIEVNKNSIKKNRNEREPREYLEIIRGQIESCLKKNIHLSSREIFYQLRSHFEQNKVFYPDEHGVDFEFTHWPTRSEENSCIKMVIDNYKDGGLTCTRKTLENHISKIKSSLKASSPVTS